MSLSQTDVEDAAKLAIANSGLRILGATKITSLATTATGPIETRIRDGWDEWYELELIKNNWLFARKRILLEELSSVPDEEKIPRYSHVYSKPDDSLRLLNTAGNFEVYGKYVYSNSNKLALTCLMKVKITECDPYFKSVMACRVAIEMVDVVMQSADKARLLAVKYDEVMGTARRADAFTRGSSVIDKSDIIAADDWLTPFLVD